MSKSEIIIHCSDTPPSMDIGADVIRKWHVEDNGWSDIGYNVVIRRNGEIEPGRDMDGDGDVYEEVGAHAKGFNKNSIGICLIGGRKENSIEAESNFTWAQYQSLMLVVKDIEARYGMLNIIGHRDISTKECPAFNVKAFFNY